MKDDFLKGLFESARESANGILDKVEQKLREVEPQNELENLRMQVDKLEAQLDERNDDYYDLLALVQVLLDGEVRKTVTLTKEKYDNLTNSTITLSVLDSYDDTVTIQIVQDL